MDLPKELRENLVLRAEVLKDPQKHIYMKELCRKEPIAFFNLCLFTYDPRDSEMPHKPFITWDFQDQVIMDLVEAIKKGEDHLIEKSRDMGATWLVEGVILWYWMFSEGFEALMGSRKEDAVDNGQMDSLFGKMNYMIQKLPHYMLPNKWTDKCRSFLKIRNPEKGNAIIGESSNQNFSVSGRYKCIMLDEFALWSDDCFHKDTEVLTDNGWKLISETTIDDKVYSMNTDNGEAKLMPITKLHKVYSKELITFKNKSVDIACTPNHKLIIEKKYKPKNTRIFTDTNKDRTRYKQSNGDMYFRRADEVLNQNHDNIPLTSEYIDGETPEKIFGFKAKDFMEFLGWFVSEGSCSNKKENRKINIAQSKKAHPKNVEQIKRLLKRMKLPIKYYNNSSFCISAGYLPKEMFMMIYSLGKAHEKYIPQVYLNLSKELLLSLFDSLMKGDGCRIKRKGRVDSISYATVSKRLAGNMQELAQKIGRRATIFERVNENKNWRKLYNLSIGFKKHAQITNLNKAIVEYNDYAYCVSTPYHTLFIRRNGVTSWCGNSTVWRCSADSSPCRIIVSTPRGFSNTYADIVHGRDGINVKKTRLHWTLHPAKKVGLYTSTMVDNEYVVEKLDKNYKYDDSKLLLDGKTRSPWYDRECARRSAVDVAQEIDIDYIQSGTPVFNKDDLKILGKYSDPDPKRRYAMGVDSSEGLVDPACIVILDDLGVEVYHESGFFPIDILSEKVLQLGYKYNNALVAVENNSMGLAVLGKLKEQYTNLYFQKRYDAEFDKETDTLGWRTTISTKPKLIQELEESIREEYILLSTPETIDECLHYQYSQNPSTNRISMGAAQGYHDDRVMATGIALQCLKDVKKMFSVDIQQDSDDECIKYPSGRYNYLTGERINN